MANNISSNPWRLDTAPFSYKYPVKIDNLNITDATSGGTPDHVVISDINGNTIVDWTANSSQTDYRIGKLGWVRGVVIISGGLGATSVVTINVGSGK